MRSPYDINMEETKTINVLMNFMVDSDEDSV